MKKYIPYVIFCCFFAPRIAFAQFETFKDSVVQLYGVVMTSDSLEGIPSASIMVKGQNRGTVSNAQGVFSIVVLKGDVINFTSVGYKPISVNIPRNIEGNQYSLIQLLTADTVYLAATIIKSRPTRAQFERDFVNTQVPDDQLEIARQNNDKIKRRLLMAYLPRDGKEATTNYINHEASKSYYAGQAAPINILNPFAWSEFIKAWKRGDFRNKSE